MSIKQEIISWDERSSSDIDAIYSRHCDDNNFTSQVVEFTQQTVLQKGATWLLKHHLECGQKLEANEVATIFKNLPKLEHWESKLHILQCLSYIPVAKTDKKAVEMFLRNCLVDSNKFIRA